MKEKVAHVEKCVAKKKHVAKKKSLGKSVDKKGKEKSVADARVSNQITEEWVMGVKQYSWKSHIENAKTNATNVMHIPMKISKQCFGEKQDAIKMINIEDWKGYNCVIHRARWNSYEKNIRHGWYEFAKEKKLEAEDVLYFSMSPPEDFMCFHVIKG
ncbi:hypothetical protein KIW84_012975 [Lathyrus oleraceus]|uniref:TF-B3 domain-containing protein n=1 Tax=Pisum sativum TaxID=3888 RepID=A0A9D5GXD8_PEA|nr:hypothetical protein KIW84_012975 [Pisum sativum]